MWPFDRSVRLARVRIVRIDIRARRRAIHGDPTLSNRMFVLIEQRNMISSGSNVPSSPRKEEIDSVASQSIDFTRRPSSRQPASDVAQSTVRAPRATRQDREWHWCAYLSCERKRRSDRVPATPVLNAFDIAKRFANKLTR